MKVKSAIIQAGKAGLAVAVLVAIFGVFAYFLPLNEFRAVPVSSFLARATELILAVVCVVFLTDLAREKPKI